MKFTTKTEYGLVSLIYMARNQSGHWIRIRDIVQKEGFSQAYIEKILQKLKSAGIVQSHQGKDGGYSLAKDPSQISLKSIIEALEGQTFEVYCSPKTRKDIVCTHFSMCGIRPVWQKTKDLLDDFYSGVSLESLAQSETQVQHLVA